MHARNLHRAPYDFPRLIQSCPELERFLQQHPLGGDTIDFANPAGVLTLNRALLKLHYGIVHWEIPPGYLCPPIPSRADYLHHVADLLATDHSARIPQDSVIRALDIGTGANCIYPLLGCRIYGWNFVGTELDPAAVDGARRLVKANALAEKIGIRHQPDPDAIFQGTTQPGETFAFSLCNPPFHSSREEAEAGTARKVRNLGGNRTAKPVLNFGGRSNELWCHGGEAAFIRRMIHESAARRELCGWFTTLVSKQGNLPAISRDLEKQRALDVRTLVMFAGQKQSRIVAWTFVPAERRRQLCASGGA